MNVSDILIGKVIDPGKEMLTIKNRKVDFCVDTATALKKQNKEQDQDN